MNLKRLFLLFYAFSVSMQLICQPAEKTRLLVLTVIENEPDDAQSMVRLLTYANHFDIDALVATTFIWMQKEVADWRIHEIVDAYAKVRDNLEVHEKGYPKSAELKGKIKKNLEVNVLDQANAFFIAPEVYQSMTQDPPICHVHHKLSFCLTIQC
jgi:hypothetical protein